MAFNTAQILADIMAKTNIRAIIAVSPFGGEAQLPCTQGKNASGIITPGHTQQPYTITVLDTVGDKCERRNIQIVVYDEGQAEEQAFYSQQSSPDSALAIPDTILNAIKTYVTGAPINAVSYEINSYNAELRYALVTVWVDTATTCSKKTYRIFRSGASTVSREVV